MDKIEYSFDLNEKTIKVLKADVGAYGANNRIGKVVEIRGLYTNNDVFIKMEDDNSLWNIGDFEIIKYEIINHAHFNLIWI